MFDILEGQIKSSPYVVARGMIPHDELVAEYTHAHVAMDLMKRNPERELAFTTRTVEYLWCGLPVIYNDYAELSDYIREYDAGWLVDPENALAIDKVLSEIFEYPEQVARRSLNAQRLVREKLTWDRTIGVLDHFVRYPRVRQRAIAGRQLLPGLGYLFSQARFHYRHGGIKTLADAGWAFIRRRI
jgi:glycosyltransferase involved in cell wall biosynthesis